MPIETGPEMVVKRPVGPVGPPKTTENCIEIGWPDHNMKSSQTHFLKKMANFEVVINAGGNGGGRIVEVVDI